MINLAKSKVLKSYPGATEIKIHSIYMPLYGWFVLPCLFFKNLSTELNQQVVMLLKDNKVTHLQLELNFENKKRFPDFSIKELTSI